MKKSSLFKTDALNFLSADDPDLTAITALSVSSVTTTGTEVTIDESAGLQNATATPTPAGDADDNDTSLTLPTVFSTALAAQTLVGPMLQAALSGYDGANSGANVITVSPSTTGQIPELGFTLADGEGTDSGLVAIFLSGSDYSYRKIFLYTDPNNDNIVYGRAGWDGVEGAVDDTPDDASDDTANPDGEIVFAIYLEETGTPVTGAKIWTTLYAPLMHGDTTSYDEAVDLTDKVFISAQTDFEVDLSNAPSGQNLFLMFTKTNPATYDDGGITRISDPVIIATGRDPANQSDGTKITEGDTINTSKGGGPTTFGTNNQMIVEGEGITFTFVTGANQNYTVPYEDQNEADVEANIDFTGVFNVNQAQFDVVQLQSGKSAVVLITAYNTSAAYTGATFIDGYAVDSTVQIDVADVQVWKGGVDITASLTLTQVGDAVRISGVTAGSTIVYSTDDTHNRLVVSNDGSGSGNASADFDIGGFKLTDITTENVEIGSKINFEDDGPGETLAPNAPPSATIFFDDTDLQSGAQSELQSYTVAFAADDQSGIEGPVLSSSFAFTAPSWAGSAADSGLLDTLSGNKIYLYWDINTTTGDGEILARVGTDSDADPAGAVAFKWVVDTQWTGDTPTQVDVTAYFYRAIMHDDVNDYQEANDDGTNGGDDLPDQSPEPVQQELAGLIFSIVRTDTLTDADGDTFEVSSDPLIIAQPLTFFDDGPSFDADLTAVPTLTTDDTDIPDSAGPTSFANLFTPDYGQDGFLDADDDDVIDADALVYALGVKDDGTDVASGLYDTLSGMEIVLNKEGDDVVGRAGSGGAVVFTISVNTDTGAVSITQSRAIVHDDINDHDEANDDGTVGNDDPAVDDAAIQQTMAANLITLTATITDGDMDTASSTRDIGDAFQFLDDGPALAFGNLVGTGTTEAQYGAWSQDPGADGADSLTVMLDEFRLINGGTHIGTTTFEETSPGFYEGTLTGDFDNDAATPDSSVGFSLEVKGDGSYVFMLDEQVASEITFSSADGKLDAGGPDPVRTLTIPATAVPPAGEQVVFFGVKANASDTEILSAIGIGETDPTEAQVQSGGYAFLGTANMNVSTSGIGVGNNNMNGNTNPAPEGTDESFVVNPETLMTKVTVYIDNSVQGYDPNTETLYYRIFYADGSVSDQMLVEAGDLQTYTWVAEFAGDTKTATEKLVDGLKYFEITQEAGETSMIDAVQITMGQGVTKIPVIEFTQATEVAANDIELDFTAKLTDGDGDWVSSDFTINLFANDLGTVPDFTMMGTDGEMDSFNVDLTELVGGTYGIIDGFDKPADQLLLLGDAGASFELTNPIAGSTRITVTESDADITIIDVVGVVLETTDVMIIG